MNEKLLTILFDALKLFQYNILGRTKESAN